MVDNQDYWEEIKNVAIQDTNCKKMRLRFWNNPYSLSNSDGISIGLGGQRDYNIIYKGEFQHGIDVCVPHTRIDSTAFPGLTIFRDGKTYHLMGKMYKYRPS